MSMQETPIDHSTVDDDLVSTLGGALATRLANTGALPASTELVSGSEDDSKTEPDSSFSGSTDSTTAGEDADHGAPVTTADAGLETGEGAASESAGSAEGDGDAAVVAALPSSLKVGDIEYTAADIERMQKFTDWGKGLSPEVAHAMAAIEAGQAAAVPADEFERYKAWRVAQAGKLQTAPGEDLLEDADPDLRAYVEQLTRERDQLRAGQQPPILGAIQQQEQMQREAEANIATFQTASDQWGRDRGLSAEQVEALAGVAIQNGMFQHFADQEREFHPVNGQMLRDADMASVTAKALNFALASDPELYTRVATDAQNTALRAAADKLADSAVSQKKARGASLSTSASQSTITPPVDVTKMPPDQLRSTMSKFIADREGLPQHD